ncbi:hypothetical protein ABOM_003975 [Aspergillus bombycis]|uniref:Uncharacterized protein n=1 Tax=Aspergillus bombycis TaxID=109264 RepID=A0A1F8A745_9EURO|nr:hypothetical protein ABOM_003975 [Aspergillus bombycis]OGM47175.1 hypothetical protein ABOM_003975 [Aspergillus bombycis]
MEAPAFKQEFVQASHYSTTQISQWLKYIRLPQSLSQYIQCPTEIPKTAECLCILMRCQLTTYPYENLSVHYSSTHLVNIHPDVLYEKMMGPNSGRRGGYCMELSIFFYHMLRGLGFNVFMTGVRNRSRTGGIPGGQYLGWTHIVNIVHLPSHEKYSLDVAFGGDGPTSPLPLDDECKVVQNLGPQQVCLVHENIPMQQPNSPKFWIYQYRNGADREWNSFYSFTEIEFFQEDFEVMNWFASSKTIHRWMVMVVRFLREGESLLFEDKTPKSSTEVKIIGKVILVNNVVKANMGGKSQTICVLGSEAARLQALRDYFGIDLTSEQRESIHGWDMALEQ